MVREDLIEQIWFKFVKVPLLKKFIVLRRLGKTKRCEFVAGFDMVFINKDSMFAAKMIAAVVDQGAVHSDCKSESYCSSPLVALDVWLRISGATTGHCSLRRPAIHIYFFAYPAPVSQAH